MLEKCYGNCSRISDERELSENASVNYTLRLVCREDSTLVLEIINFAEQNKKMPGIIGQSPLFDGRIFLFKVREAGKNRTPTILFIVSASKWI